MRNNIINLFAPSAILKLLLFLTVCFFLLTSLPAHSATQQKKVPAGSPVADTIHFQYAVYFLPLPSKDPVAVLGGALHDQKVSFKMVDSVPEESAESLVSAHLEKNVSQNYAPLDLDSLRYFGRGLSREQAVALQGSKQAFILDFGYSKKHMWDALRTATVVVEKVARETSGLVWDEETREIFTPDEWHDRRLAKWSGQIPTVSRHTIIHVYQDNEYVRAITLGMSKFGLPDVVVQNFSWSQNRNMGHLINAFCQVMAEGASFPLSGRYNLDIRAIRDAQEHEQQHNSLMPNAKKVARLTLLKGVWQEGDPRNRLIELDFNGYPGKDIHAKQNAMLNSLYGWEDQVKHIRHDDELRKVSRQARKQLPTLRKAFKTGLQPGEYIELKAPFATANSTEWMWVEVTSWSGNLIEGILKNEPFDIPDLHGGQLVRINEDQVFDYIRRHPDGTQEGNETGKLIEKMQGRTEQSK